VPQFAEAVRELADFTLTDEAQLAGILRQMDGLERLSTVAAATREEEAEAETQSEPLLTGLLAAARDREEETSEQSKREPSDSEDAG
jgi:hypothetical protein